MNIITKWKPILPFGFACAARRPAVLLHMIVLPVVFPLWAFRTMRWRIARKRARHRIVVMPISGGPKGYLPGRSRSQHSRGAFRLKEVREASYGAVTGREAIDRLIAQREGCALGLGHGKAIARLGAPVYRKAFGGARLLLLPETIIKKPDGEWAPVLCDRGHEIGIGWFHLGRPMPPEMTIAFLRPRVPIGVL